MLDDFVPEVPVAPTPQKTAELVGFEPEARLETSAPVTTSKQRNWRQFASPSMLLTVGGVCAALMLGVVSARSGHAPQAPPEKLKLQFRVSAEDTPGGPSTPRPATSTPSAATSAPAVPARPLEPLGAEPRDVDRREPERAEPERREPGLREPQVAERVTPTAARPSSAAPAGRPMAAAGVLVDPQPSSQQVHMQPIPAPLTPAVNEPLRSAAPSPAPAPVAPVAAIAPPITIPRTVALGVSLPPTVETAGRSVMEEAAVRTLLDGYKDAYEQLDVRAARRVWPSVDDRRLARAFSDLESQKLDFEECDIDLTNDRGVARCRGRATYVGRVGKRAPQTLDRSWTFQIHRTGNRWAIDSVRTE